MTARPNRPGLLKPGQRTRLCPPPFTLIFAAATSVLVACGQDDGVPKSLDQTTRSSKDQRTAGGGEAKGTCLIPRAGIYLDDGSRIASVPESLVERDGSVMLGDMILHSDPSFALQSPYPVNFVVNRWPKAVIPYVIDTTVLTSPEFGGSKLSDRVIAAIQDMEQKTLIRFEPHDKNRHGYYLRFISDGNPRSTIGFAGAIPNGQGLYLAHTIAMAGIQHELSHALGVFHEESRSDRNEHIIVHPERMISQCYDAYIAITYNTGYNLTTPYDFSSIMHSSLNVCVAPGSNGLETLEPKAGEKLPVGLRSMSPSDIQEINDLYRTEAAARDQALAANSGPSQGNAQGNPTSGNQTDGSDALGSSAASPEVGQASSAGNTSSREGAGQVAPAGNPASQEIGQPAVLGYPTAGSADPLTGSPAGGSRKASGDQTVTARGSGPAQTQTTVDNPGGRSGSNANNDQQVPSGANAEREGCG